VYARIWKRATSEVIGLQRNSSELGDWFAWVYIIPGLVASFAVRGAGAGWLVVSLAGIGGILAAAIIVSVILHLAGLDRRLNHGLLRHWNHRDTDE
jgi:hypothetical protein